MKTQEKTYILYKSEEARRRLLSLYEAGLTAWPAAEDGSSLERHRIATSFGETAVFAFGSGLGRPLILLHGTLSNSAMWLGDAAVLGRGRRAFAVDIPGEPGASEERALPWSGEAAAAWLGEVVAGLGLGGGRETFDLLGLSIGGWIALDYAVRKPEALASLALLCPSGIGRTRPSFMWKAMFAMARGKRGLEALSRSLYGDFPPSEEAIQFGMLMSEATNPRMEEAALFDDGELAGIESPIFLAVGEKDGLLRSKESAERLGRLRPGAEIHLLLGAGHALIGQGKSVVDFLDRHQQASIH